MYQKMSDEFLKIATKEINEELESVAEILNSCKDDNTISKSSISLEKHFHKIKGLAPMMGQEEIGEIAALIDKILKHLIAGNSLEGIRDILIESNDFMKNSMTHQKIDVSALKQKININYSNILT